MRTSDLPEFSSILDDHRFAALGELSEEDVAEQSGAAKRDPDDEPVARDWIDGLVKGWDPGLEQEPLDPLAELVRRVSALSGVPCPALDESEADRATVRLEEGLSDDD